MIRGTTPELTFNLKNADTSNLKSLYVTFTDRENNVLLEKTLEDCTVLISTIKVKLTQEETLSFKGRQSINVQLRAVYADGEAYATDIYSDYVADILKDGVIE